VFNLCNLTHNKLSWIVEENSIGEDGRAAMSESPWRRKRGSK
jgi:hypothetical protein